MKPEVRDLYKNRTNQEVKELLIIEGDSRPVQFEEWWDVFQILSECRKYSLAEI